MKKLYSKPNFNVIKIVTLAIAYDFVGDSQFDNNVDWGESWE